MLNEISCFYWDWGATGAIATGLGALATACAVWQAYFFWRRGQRQQAERTAKRVLVNKILMREELGRLGVLAATVYDLAHSESEWLEKAKMHLSYMKEGLVPHRGEALLEAAEDLDEELVEAAAIAVRDAHLLLNMFTNLATAMELKEPYRHSIQRLSANLQEACNDLAYILKRRSYSRNGWGVVESLEGLPS